MVKLYERLAEAIVANAAKDYRDATKKLKKEPDNEAARRLKQDCKRFFSSGWFTELSGLDGAYVLMKLEEEENDY